jgi:hypothetical protein
MCLYVLLYSKCDSFSYFGLYFCETFFGKIEYSSGELDKREYFEKLLVGGRENDNRGF